MRRDNTTLFQDTMGILEKGYGNPMHVRKYRYGYEL